MSETTYKLIVVNKEGLNIRRKPVIDNVKPIGFLNPGDKVEADLMIAEVPGESWYHLKRGGFICAFSNRITFAEVEDVISGIPGDIADARLALGQAITQLSGLASQITTIANELRKAIDKIG